MKKTGLFHTMKAKLLTLVLCIALISAAAVAAMSYLCFRQTLKKQTLAWVGEIAEARKNHVRSLINELKTRTADASADGHIRRYLDLIGNSDEISRTEHIASLNQYLSDKQKINCGIAAIAIVNMDGTVIASGSREMTGADFSDHESFIMGAKGCHISDPCHSPYLNIKTIYCSAPLAAYSGERSGVVIIACSLNVLNEITCQRAGLRESGETYIVNKEKLMITDSRFIENAPLEVVVDTQPVRLALERGENMAGIYTDYRNIPIVGASAYMPECGWTLLSEIDKAEAFASLKYQGIAAGIIGSICAALAAVIGSIFAVSLSNPIGKLTNAAKRFAKGDTDINIETSCSGEICELSRSFNAMFHDIKTKTSELIKNNERLAGALSIARMGNWEWDIAKNEIYWSDEVYRIFGRTKEEFSASYEAFLEYVHPDDLEYVKKSVEYSLNNKKPYGIEHRILLKDNTVRIVEKKASVLFDDTGKAIRMAGTVQDITEWRRRENEMNLLQAVILAVGEAENLHDALVITLEKVCIATGWIYGEAWVPQPNGKYLERDHTYYSRMDNLERFSELSGEYRFSPGVGLPGRTWTEKKPVWIRDVTIDPNYPRAPFALEAGLKAGVAFPIMTDGNVVAVIEFYMTESRERDEWLISLVSSVTVQLGHVIRRKQAEDALQKSEALLHSILDNTTAVVYAKDLRGRYIFINKRFEELFHVKKEEIAGRTDYDLWPAYMADTFRRNDRKVIEAAMPLEFDEIALHDDREHIYISIKFPLYDETGAIMAVCGISTDITERRHMEREREKLREQLYHSQKMETAGQLVGSIAHDFNNILTAIIGYMNLVQMEMEMRMEMVGGEEGSDPSLDYVQKALFSAERAERLTRGLLTFSRKQINDPKPVNLVEIVTANEDFLLRTIGPHVVLKTSYSVSDCIVIADRGQIEQILMNLSVNARDAMPDGGVLAISTDVMEFDDNFIKTHGYGEPGMYAVIAVSDEGTGMDVETRKKIFEPFFTTKEAGKGTGLGLAIVYGIVKQHKGLINVYSEPGKGTTFRIYLPLTNTAAESKDVKPEETFLPVLHGVETILIAEDQEEVRHLVKTALEINGYNVIAAVDGADAIDKFMKNHDTIQLCLFDVIMPGKNGREAYDAIREKSPGVKVLFTSGYSEDIISQKMIYGKGLNFIPKPVSPAALLKKVREVLDNSC